MAAPELEDTLEAAPVSTGGRLVALARVLLSLALAGTIVVVVLYLGALLLWVAALYLFAPGDF